MAEPISDSELVRQFAQQRSESAFRLLVERHADLVYATALRRTGDSTTAQDVMQEVFTLLARKSAWLRGESSLAGWLYKTTVLQARQWWRGEGRRRRREQAAVELNTTMRDNETHALAELLDEALMELPQNERQVLLLRFFEQRSHREVGIALGIAEDAARKRTDKALARLTGWFAKRGYAVGTAAVAAAAASAAAVVAPTGAVAVVAQAAFAQAPSGALAWATGCWARLMRPSAGQTAAMCVAVLLTPAAWQGARWLSAVQEQRRMQALLSALQTQHEAALQEQTELQRQLRHAANSLGQLQVLSAYSALLTEATLDPRLFRWDEAADYVRVPKVVLQWAKFDTGERYEETTFTSHGARLSPTLLGVMGVSAEDQERVQRFCQEQMDAYRAMADARGYLTNGPPSEAAIINFAFTEASRAWVVPALAPEQSAAWRERFEQGLARLIGADRAQICLANASEDGSLSACFERFGAEDLVIAATPDGNGECKLSKLYYFPDGKPRGMSSGSVPDDLESVLILTASEPPDPSKSEGRKSFGIWHSVLGRRPLPVALADYLREWAAAHPKLSSTPAP